MASLATRPHRHPSPRAGVAGAQAVGAEPRDWLRALSGGEPARGDAIDLLHTMLLRAARCELARRGQRREGDLDDLATQAADDALIAVLSKLHSYRGESRFTTWAYKFALLEAAVQARRRAWRGRELPVEADGRARLADRAAGRELDAERAELLAAVCAGIAERLTSHQRTVLVALALNDVPIDVLADRLDTTRGALYKTLHDARRCLRAHLTRHGYAIDDAIGDGMTGRAPMQAPDRLAAERWVNEGGHEGSGRVGAREICRRQARARTSSRPRVLIVGAGVAGLETLLALRALAGSRVDVTLLAPGPKFINHAMAVDQPFTPQRVRGVRLQDIADELDARWHRGALDRVEHAHRRAVTKDGHELAYDALVLAPGARTARASDSQAVITFRDNRDAPGYRMLLRQLARGQVDRLAFVKPPGASWPLPLYDLAVLTAAHCAGCQLDVEVCLITPEDAPLSIFGDAVSTVVRQQLEERGVAVHTNCYGAPRGDGWLEIRPGARRMCVDRIVTLPSLVGPRLRGIPCSRDGYIHTDPHGRVRGLAGVFAAGDATTFPVKQGGLAAQQADAVAETIAASVGINIVPRPFRPVLRGMLLTGGRAWYMRADISGGASTDSMISSAPLWWPPNKLCGRYLAPFLSSRVGDAADVTPQHAHDAPLEQLEPETPHARIELIDFRAPPSSHRTGSRP